MSTTPILGLLVPTVNGDNNTWGTKLNTDLVTIDSLGAATVDDASSNFLITTSTFPEVFYRVTTGGMTVTGTLPDPGLIPTGKLFTIKIIDIGSVTLQSANPTVTIDGQLTYFLGNQYNFVRLLANGSTYDVVAYG